MKSQKILTIIIFFAMMLIPVLASAETTVHNHTFVEASSGNQQTGSESGESQSEVRIKSIINGEVVTDIHKVSSSSVQAESINVMNDTGTSSATTSLSSTTAQKSDDYYQDATADQLMSTIDMLNKIKQLLIRLSIHGKN